MSTVNRMRFLIAVVAIGHLAVPFVTAEIKGIPFDVGHAVEVELPWVASPMVEGNEIAAPFGLKGWAVWLKDQDHERPIHIYRDIRNAIHVFWDFDERSMASGGVPVKTEVWSVLLRKVDEFNMMVKTQNTTLNEDNKNIYIKLVKESIFMEYASIFMFSPPLIRSEIAITGNGVALRIHKG